MLFAIGVGMINLSPTEMMAMELRDFMSAYQGWSRLREHSSREATELTRWQTAAIATLLSTKPIAPTELLSLPWDEGVQPKVLTAEERAEARQRQEALLALIDKKRENE
jgi:hypothetical protein